MGACHHKKFNYLLWGSVGLSIQERRIFRQLEAFTSALHLLLGWIETTYNKQHYEMIAPGFEARGVRTRFSEYVESLGELKDWSKNKQRAQSTVDLETVADKILPFFSLQVWSRFSRMLGASRVIGGRGYEL